ncbi:MAG TPA: hypothetical protein VEW65_01725, partial [Chryseolinea sp.]|nr:hypothetical protein [Chryseolinea sp.]
MINSKTLSLLLLLIPIVTFGQVKLSKDFKVTLGAPYPVVDAGNKEYFSDGKGATIAVKTDGEKVTIQRYSIESMKETNRKVYEDFPANNKVQKVIKVGDKIFYIFSAFNKKEEKEDVYSREINTSDGTFQASKLLFSTASEVGVSSYAELAGMTMFGLGAPIRFEVHKSFDNSKMLIRYRLKPAERDDDKNFDVLGFYVFDSNLNKQWGGEIKMPYTEKQMNNLAYGVSKDGKAYMLAYINKSKQFELLNITKDLKVKANKVDIDGTLFFEKFYMQEAADGNLACAGYYANGLDIKVSWTGSAAGSYNTNGILAFKMNQDGKVLENYNLEFPLELINQYESKRAQDKNAKREGEGKAGINDLKIIDIAWNEDGSTTIIGEQQYIRKEYVRTSMATVFYYGDVVATKFDKKGNVLWMKKLP